MFWKSTALKWYIALTFIGAALALILPPNPTTLHILSINTTEYRTVIFTLILPYALIWFSAFLAYEKLEQYAKKLQATREGEAFKKIADGVRVLAWGMALPTILTIILSTVEGWHASFRGVQIIIDNYVALIVPLISFTYIANGAHALTETVRARPRPIGIRILTLAFVVIGVFFTYFVVHNQSSNNNAYYLPLIALLMTIVIPYLYAWFVGLLGAYDLRLYSQKTRGVLYQRALVWLAAGITVVIIGSIMVQYLDGILAGRASVALSTLLVTVYSFLAIQATGFVLIVLGADRLKKIEEV